MEENIIIIILLVLLAISAIHGLVLADRLTQAQEELKKIQQAIPKIAC